ncbi:DUF4886 domain-containing protein [Erythrobacter sp. GH1-10]|uniref:DUF4886 domain-containing protein n=1 Tax=Erythrobacter sp. GH1-10 TaxID=3349334 RepID=UPI003877D132
MRAFAAAIALSALLAGSACSLSADEVRSTPAAMAALPSADPQVRRLTAERPTHILFVGNSYLYYNDSLHNHVERMAVAAGLFHESEPEYKSATIGGAALFDHNIDHLLEPGNLRVDRPFDVVIMQGGSAAPLSPDRRMRFAETAETYAARVRAMGGEPVLYMTHAYVFPHPRAREDMIEDIASLYIETGNRIGALVIPVGLAFDEAYRRRPDISLHASFDGTHPSMLGTYLAACTVLASIYGANPIGNSYDYFGEVPAEDALFLQQVAQDTVLKFYRREG